MSVLQAVDNKIIFKTRDETVCLEAYGESCVRVRATRCGKISDENWTLLPPEKAEVKVICDGERAELQNGMLTAELFKVWGGYRILFRRNGKEILHP